MIRVVLDTNVWVSGSINPEGIPGQILRAWREERFEVIVSEEILEEMERVFVRPKIRERIPWSDEEAKEKVTTLLLSIYEGGVVTPGEAKLRVVKDDPTDDKFFVAAVEGEADYIVSGDRRLQKIKKYRGIQILAPSQFLKRLKPKGKRRN